MICFVRHVLSRWFVFYLCVCSGYLFQARKAAVAAKNEAHSAEAAAADAQRAAVAAALASEKASQQQRDVRESS